MVPIFDKKKKKKKNFFASFFATKFFFFCGNNKNFFKIFSKSLNKTFFFFFIFFLFFQFHCSTLINQFFLSFLVFVSFPPTFNNHVLFHSCFLTFILSSPLLLSFALKMSLRRTWCARIFGCGFFLLLLNKGRIKGA